MLRQPGHSRAFLNIPENPALTGRIRMNARPVNICIDISFPVNERPEKNPVPHGLSHWHFLRNAISSLSSPVRFPAFGGFLDTFPAPPRAFGGKPLRFLSPCDGESWRGGGSGAIPH